MFELSIRATAVVGPLFDPHEYWRLFHSQFKGHEKKFREAIGRMASEAWNYSYVDPQVKKEFARLAENPGWVCLDKAYDDGVLLREIAADLNNGGSAHKEIDYYSVMRDSVFMVFCDPSVPLSDVYDADDLKVGDELEMKQDLRFKFYVITNSEGRKAIPLFSCLSALPKGFQEAHPMVFHQHYVDCVELSVRMGLDLVIDPFTNPVALSPNEAVKYTFIPSRIRG